MSRIHLLRCLVYRLASDCTGELPKIVHSPFVHSLLVTSGNPSVTMRRMTPGSTIGLVRRFLVELYDCPSRQPGSVSPGVIQVLREMVLHMMVLRKTILRTTFLP
jgi:hypothetical protein